MTLIELFLLAVTMLLAIMAGLCDMSAPRRNPRIGLVVGLFAMLCYLWQHHRDWPLMNNPHFFDLALVWFILIAAAYLCGLALSHYQNEHQYSKPAK